MPKQKSRRFKIGSLFAGVGGFELGFGSAGFDLGFSCEIDPAARAVLTERFSKLQIERDVRLVDSLPTRLDVLTAGFPCQDLSSVGLKAGMRGTRSSLVSHVFRLLKSRPTNWVILENVFFMLHLDRGKAMHTITTGLERLGYKWAYRVLDSLGFGVPQRRRRVYFVASLHEDPRNVLLVGDHRRGEVVVSLEKPVGFYWTEGAYATGLAYDAVPPLKGGSTIGIPSPPAILMPGGLVGTPSLYDAERLQGFPPGWTEPAAEVVRNSMRWRLVGNAISVPVVRWIAEGVSGARRASYVGVGDCKLASDQTWPTAAYNVGEGRFVSDVGEHASTRPTPGLNAFLRRDLNPLSRKATLGFLSRVAKGNLTYPSGFITALERHSRRVA